MDFHLSFLSNGDISNIGECVPIIAKKGAENFNIFIESSEVLSHWEEFQKSLFISDLLGFNGLFVLGKLDQSIEKKTEELYSKSVFSSFENIEYVQDKNKTINFPKRKRKLVDEQLSGEYVNHIRTIIVWNGKHVLNPGSKIKVEFNNEKRVGEVKQVQKIIHANFEGSAFGINRLEPGEIGTTTIILNEKIQMFYYDDNNSLGVFNIKKDNIQIGYGIIIR